MAGTKCAGGVVEINLIKTVLRPCRGTDWQGWRKERQIGTEIN
jgi:hypothetical protein